MVVAPTSLPSVARSGRRTKRTWGVFGISERDVGVFDSVVEGASVVELGCGTAYVSAWLARRGARSVGVDPSAGQLRLASGFRDEFGVYFPLLRAAGEQVPLASGGFDFVVSEYGAALWADPVSWFAEAARLLRVGGELVFLVNSGVLTLCVPDVGEAGDRLLRTQRETARLEWPGEPGVEFHPSHGDWLRLLRSNGFEVLELRGLHAPEHPQRRPYFVALSWATRWPAEDLWRARRV